MEIIIVLTFQIIKHGKRERMHTKCLDICIVLSTKYSILSNQVLRKCYDYFRWTVGSVIFLRVSWAIELPSIFNNFLA